LGETSVNISGSEMTEYFAPFKNSQESKVVNVVFSTKDSVTGDQPKTIELGCVQEEDLNVSEVYMFAEMEGNDGNSRILMSERFNADTVALGARYLDPKVLVKEFSLQEKMLMLGRGNDNITGVFTLFNGLAYNVSLRIRIVCYDITGREYPIANQFIDIQSLELTTGLAFNITSDLGLKEGKHNVVMGIYYQEELIYRYGDNSYEMYDTAFLASEPRIKSAAVLPTDRIRPGGNINLRSTRSRQ